LTDKKSFQIAIAVYSFFIIFSGFFLITYMDSFLNTGELFSLLLVIFNSFVIGYCGMRIGKWYKKWLIYQKYGVKGTWED